jgi:RHH-type proline utilization regulon transcriptional repressor/proline dehydrogenase/delta 1-pyrroline-5-carboxylate dehydrogenase
MDELNALRQTIRDHHLAPEPEVLERLRAAGPGPERRQAASARAAGWVREIRQDRAPALVESFLAEYGLSTREGIALMCLAEALLRVPDAHTMDELIEDKIAPSAWGEHLGHSSSSLVNASTWALMLTGSVLKETGGVAATLRGAVRRLGEPVIRVAARRAVEVMATQFVLGRDIDEAVRRGQGARDKGYTYSYDMLGEAAMTAADAGNFYASYERAIHALAPRALSDDIRENPGISVKLSALHPRYEETKRARVMAELVPRVLRLAQGAKAAHMGFNIDAEEADRLDLSLEVIEAVLSDPSLAGWNGFGVVVQAYGKRAAPVLDWLHALAERLDRRIMVRLVKGAYWDTEIKRAQVAGLEDFPVFTRKAATDISFQACAAKLLAMRDRIYPQFATHNAQTVAAVLEMAGEARDFEFQRLHGMGEALHDLVMARAGTRCRIYAPVGTHRDLLAYLVRRLLENGANSSFVNQIVDTAVPAEEVAADPFAADLAGGNAQVVAPARLWGAERENAKGWDLADRAGLAAYDAARAPFAAARWEAAPLLAAEVRGGGAEDVANPADPSDVPGRVTLAGPEDVEAALAAARPWQADGAARARVLNAAADLYEQNAGEIFAILGREAGKTPPDAVAELREAVDFLRYYAARARELEAPPRGTFACISPWNFPLAIFTGQIAGALAAGNAVLAKPAEATPLIAHLGVTLMHRAGVPRETLQFLPGEGRVVGRALTSDARIDGVAFTGSTATAQAINRAMAEHLDPRAPLIAETGGLNAMIVDSTALPEQAVRDIVVSAFQSAGQRCSACRMLYVQEDVADRLLEMLFGAMDELALGNPWDPATDVGPVIDATAREGIEAHVAAAEAEGRLLKRLEVPGEGHFVGPAVIRVPGIDALEREIFGPVLHVATFRGEEIDAVVDAVNATGYGLTFGMHSRIDDRVEQVAARARVGNLYVNRNQIGAIVGSQPFGGEGLSGTGPKAGGPFYVPRFARAEAPIHAAPEGAPVNADDVQALLDRIGPAAAETDSRMLPGPTGESNRLSRHPRAPFLCLGPTAEAAAEQARAVRGQGGRAIVIAPGVAGENALDGVLAPEALERLEGFGGVALWAEAEGLRPYRRALAAREGALLPLVAEADLADRCLVERHLCIDTTAAGGNAELLAAAA